jgi:hypothetical protein
MIKNAFIFLWLPLLRELVPPAGLILVGAGAGTSSWARLLQEWNLPGTILVEPDDAQFLQLQQNVSRFGCWRLHKQLVAGLAEEVTFHQASNSTESGLLDPESLRSIWPNIKTRQRKTVAAITLASLQREEGHSANWLMVDCLPALPIVQGAAELLDAFDVIAVRVVFDDKAFDTGTASQSELESYLNSRGYRCIATEAGRHPAVGHALYVRDMQQVIHRLRQQQVQLKHIHQAEVQKLARQNSVAEQQASELQRRISQLTGAQRTADNLTTEREQRINQLEQGNAAQAELLLKVRGELANSADEYIAQGNELKQAKVTADRFAAERQQQIDQLKQANASQAEQLAQSRAELSKTVDERVAQGNSLTQARAAADKLAGERQQQVEQLKQANANQEKQLVQSRAELSKVVEERATQLDQLTQLRAAKEKLAVESQQKIEQLAEGNRSTEKVAGEWQKKFEYMTSQLTGFLAHESSSLAEIRNLLKANNENERYVALSKKFDGLLEEQKTLFNQSKRYVTEDLANGLANTTKQIEAFISVQNFINNRQIPLNFHGWPISPDIALFMVGKIINNQYDMIIEFGSGTSTVIFAQALLNSKKKTFGNKDEVRYLNEMDQGMAAQHLSAPLDSYKKIISFEHNKFYCEKTIADLEERGLNGLVEVMHAPLVDYHYDGQKYLYYACEDKLAEVARMFGGRIAKILVLVDGPPGVIGPLARFPAIPHLLSKLSAHQVDILLDDFNRAEEKEIAEKWKQMFDKRNLRIAEENVVCEKGAFFCRLNP